MVSESEMHLVRVFINNLNQIKKYSDVNYGIKKEIAFWEDRLKGMKLNDILPCPKG